MNDDYLLETDVAKEDNKEDLEKRIKDLEAQIAKYEKIEKIKDKAKRAKEGIKKKTSDFLNKHIFN